MYKKLLFIILSITISGCSSISDVYNLYQVENHLAYLEAPDSFDENKLVHDPALRAYKYSDAIVIDAMGRKVNDRDEAEKLLTIWTRKDYEKDSDKYVAGGVIAYGIVNLYYTIPYRLGLWVVDLPFRPAFKYEENKHKQLIFNLYTSAFGSFNSENYEEALYGFEKVLRSNFAMKSNSDALYWIARSYEKRGDSKKARSYFKDFIQYSFRRYPAYFETIDERYKNSKDELSSLFDEAEKKQL